jgi:hypothetical protein
MPRTRKPSDPPDRVLRVYAFDPSRGARLENHLTIRIGCRSFFLSPSIFVNDNVLYHSRSRRT